MAGLIIRAKIHPDMETGPGEPDPGMEAQEMAGMAKKPGQFALPKSPIGAKKKGKAPPKKGAM